MLQLTACGNIGRDAVIRQNGNDISINFSVATNRKYLKDGVQVEQTNWVDCTIWRKPGESTEIAKYLVAGTKVLVQGQPDVRAYVDNNGEVRASQTLRVTSHELVGAAKQQEAPAPAATEKAAPPLPSSLTNPGAAQRQAEWAGPMPASNFEADAASQQASGKPGKTKKKKEEEEHDPLPY